MNTLDTEITFLEGEIDRIDREINQTLGILTSTPRINVPNPSVTGQRVNASSRLNVDPSPQRGNSSIIGAAGTGRASQPRAIQPAVASNSNQNPFRPKNFIKPATYDGTGLWNDYLSHFESVSLINNWTDVEKGLYLAASLRGQAQGVLGNQPKDDRQNYTKLVQALQDRFAPSNQTELYRAQLRERRQKASESLPEMGQDIRRLANLAYPTASSDLKEVLATEQFLDGLHDSEMRLKIKQARPVNLNDAIQRAVELEAFYRAERRQREIVRSVDTEVSTREQRLESLIETMQKSMTSLEQEMKNMKRSQYRRQKSDDKGSDSKGKGVRKCFKCDSPDHLFKNCPSRSNQGRYDGRVQTNEQNNDKRWGKGYESRNEGDKSNREEKHSRNIQVIKESGLYVKASVEGMDASLLVDTGATVSVISKVVFETLSLTCKYPLHVVQDELLAANGSPLEVIGRTRMGIAIGQSKLEQDFIVANVNVDGILGIDFLSKHKCVIDIERLVISVLGTEHKLRLEGMSTSYKISLVNRISMPPRAEVIVKGKICASDDGRLPSRIGMIEPIESFARSNAGIVAKTLVRSQEIVPVRILNPLSETQTIHPGTIIGTLSPIEKVVSSSFDIDEVSCKKSCHDIPSHIKDLYEKCTSDLGIEDKQKAKALLLRYAHLFSTSDEDVGRTDLVKHKINTGDKDPIKQAPRRLPVHMQGEVEEHITDMLRRGVIEPSKSPWASPIVLAKKKDGSTRFCIDYRRLNNVTVKDAYPLPKIDESLSQLNGSNWFCALDMNTGYWQVELDARDKEKTAFVSRQGLYEFNVMPFGLCNAPATFERLMDTVLSGLQWQVCLIYLDDIIVYGKTFDAMLANLEKVFQKLLSAGLKLKARKCTLFAKQVKYLGHVISEKGIETDPDKVSVVERWPQPMDKTQVRSFIGLCGYYRKFIANFAEIARPLHKLTEATTAFKWTDDCQRSFDLLKQKLTDAPILICPDFTKKFILDTDASQNAVGAVLSQVIDGKERVVAYASKALSKSERRYCVTRKELYAVVTFIKHFRPFLYGRKFLVRTDHNSLRWLLRFKDPEGQLARWLEVISSYDMDIEHRAGKLHRNADSLSRVPCNQCGYYDDWDKDQSVPKHIGEIHVKEKDDLCQFDQIQNDDKDIGLVKAWVHENKRPDYKAISAESYTVKSLWCQWSLLVLKDKILYRLWDDEETGLPVHQAIVPSSERRKVLHFCHDSKTAGHLGVHKTISKIRQGYYWPGLQSDVRGYIRGCDTCSRRKSPSKTKRAPMQTVQVGYPMERLATDILGEFPETEHQNRYILVVSDYFSKWTEAFPMPNMEAKTVARIIVNEVICRFGVPNAIHSDQGRQYESQLFSEVCLLLQIQKTRTTPYHPQSDGMVERFNKTLVTMLSSYVADNHRDWDEHIPYVLMAYRATEHESTGFSPNMLMLGRETSTPLDIIYEMPVSWKMVPENEWAWVLKERMERAHRLVRENSERSTNRQKHYHDMRMSFERFKDGDSVYVYFPQRKIGCSPKLTSYWRGPFVVTGKLTEVLYKVNCGRNGREQVIHCDRMKACREQVLRGETSMSNDLNVEDESVSVHDEQVPLETVDEYPGMGNKGLEAV